jgi:hypothetical protein
MSGDATGIGARLAPETQWLHAAAGAGRGGGVDAYQPRPLS